MISAQGDLLFIRGTSRPGLPKTTGQYCFLVLPITNSGHQTLAWNLLCTSIFLDFCQLYLVLTYHRSEWQRKNFLASEMILRGQPLVHAVLGGVKTTLYFSTAFKNRQQIQHSSSQNVSPEPQSSPFSYACPSVCSPDTPTAQELRAPPRPQLSSPHSLIFPTHPNHFPFLSPPCHP